MRQVPLERDINIAVNGCSGFATSTRKGPFMAMLISHSRGTYLINRSVRSTRVRGCAVGRHSPGVCGRDGVPLSGVEVEVEEEGRVAPPERGAGAARAVVVERVGERIALGEEVRLGGGWEEGPSKYTQLRL